ncbi:hypothetical protein Mh1950_23730 [Mannheimia haemolytica]|nr:hypothetical protein COI_2394 [Mannheimia haemolytica serotype A2 str. OVINE]EEY12458.1 hypothetical protein COK_1438 [Mannheimia haemolytica serotype A2 str. BOVINE]KYL06219.1 hypothetical protein AC568_11160 [Mannheimia haemolytica]KYL15931.1 hypothetical protein AC571_08460 [Mannheimia haemolytica]KYL22420.1 hypothetical protein AC574_07865 [Mannheimia haemolytica]
MEVVSELAKSQGKAASSTDDRSSISPLVGGLKGSFLVGGTALLMISAMPAEAVVSQVIMLDILQAILLTK